MDRRGLLITGSAGSGKSSLALAMMGMGAKLVSDDRVILMAVGEDLLARAPATLQGKIEARGIGILRAETVDETVLFCVVDLDQVEEKRFPETRRLFIQNVSLPLLLKADTPHFPSMLMQFMKCGRDAPGT